MSGNKTSKPSLSQPTELKRTNVSPFYPFPSRAITNGSRLLLQTYTRSLTCFVASRRIRVHCGNGRTGGEYTRQNKVGRETGGERGRDTF